MAAGYVLYNGPFSHSGVLLLTTELSEATNCRALVTDEGNEANIPCVCQELFQSVSNRLVAYVNPTDRDTDIACDTHIIMWYREVEIGYCDKYSGVVMRPEFNHTMIIYTNGTLAIYKAVFADRSIYTCYVMPAIYYTELIVRGE